MSPAMMNIHETVDTGAAFEGSLDYVTVFVGEQMFGLPIARVQDVFMTKRITPVPHAPAEIVGLLNLRGRVVTAICLHRRLGVPSPDIAARCATEELVAVGVDVEGEAYALIVDAVGEVLRLDTRSLEPTPIHLDRRWTALANGVHRLEDRLLVVLDVDAVLKITLAIAA